MTCQELADRLGSVCVSGHIIKGDALLQYIRRMPGDDRDSLIADLALLDAADMSNTPSPSQSV